ncbi:caspase domain-containing protein [Mycena epipterygia]|nr:caspase domain-containing protein [Mycena epipterygia]
MSMTPNPLFQSTFALIIGINKYEANEISTLNGCENDAEAFAKFLTEDCAIPQPETRIVKLIGAEATRDNIIEKVQSHLINNAAIPSDGALMILFFAGHGSSCKSVDFGTIVETICPYDTRMTKNGQYVHGIPDYVFGWLLEDLAQNKGTNITMILDSCHSGGLSRDSESGTPRRLDADTTPISLAVDRNLHRGRVSSRALGRWNAAASSHILLAACGEKESAYETDSTSAGRIMGRFTASLLNALRTYSQEDFSTQTYSDLLKSLDSKVLDKQRPHCGHRNQDWLVFTNTKSKHSWLLQRNPSDPDTFKVDIGELGGISTDTEFSLVTSDGSTNPTLTVVGVVKSNHSILRLKEGSRQLLGYRVRVTDWSKSGRMLKVAGNNIFPHLVVESEHNFYSEHNFMFSPLPDILVRKSEEEIIIEWQAGSMKAGIIPKALENTSFKFRSPRHLFSILDGLAHFNYIFNQSKSRGGTNTNIQLKIYELMGPFGARQPNLDVGNIVQDNAAQLTAVNGKKYAFEMCSDSPRDLYPYLFYLNPQTYQIDVLYLPPGEGAKPTLHSNGTLQVGAGAEDAFEFEEDSSMFGILKLFVSTEYHQLDWIEQSSLFDVEFTGNGKPRGFKRIREGNEFWKVIQVPVQVKM